MTRNFKLASLASATAAVLIILPVARTGNNHILTSKPAPTSVAEEADAQHAQNAQIFATKAAYFDGVVQGKRAASQHLDASVPMGRWSAPADKDAFAAGYRDGYALGLADSKSTVPAR
jgi:hypothetical protein